MGKPCRGFECKRYHVQRFGRNNSLSHSFCEKDGVRQSMDEGAFEKCSACEHLNECTECIHSKTCKYSTAK